MTERVAEDEPTPLTVPVVERVRVDDPLVEPESLGVITFDIENVEESLIVAEVLLEMVTDGVRETENVLERCSVRVLVRVRDLLPLATLETDTELLCTDVKELDSEDDILSVKERLLVCENVADVENDRVLTYEIE